MSSLARFFPAVGAALLIGAGGIVLAQQSTDSTTRAPGATQAQPHRHGFQRHGHAFAYGRILRQLNVTPEQKSQIKDILTQQRTQLQALAQSTRDNHEALLTTPPTDSAYAGLLATAKANAAARIDIESDIQRQIYGVLTPEQQAQIPGIVAAHRDAMKARWNARHPGAAS